MEESTAVLILLGSPAYFTSANCLRELRCAHEKRKPMVLVHESDVSKNGARLEILERVCPADPIALTLTLPY